MISPPLLFACVHCSFSKKELTTSPIHLCIAAQAYTEIDQGELALLLTNASTLEIRLMSKLGLMDKSHTPWESDKHDIAWQVWGSKERALAHTCTHCMRNHAYRRYDISPGAGSLTYTHIQTHTDTYIHTRTRTHIHNCWNLVASFRGKQAGLDVFRGLTSAYKINLTHILESSWSSACSGVCVWLLRRVVPLHLCLILLCLISLCLISLFLFVFRDCAYILT